MRGPASIAARSRSKEAHVHACECGSTLKLSTLDPDEARMLVGAFDALHHGHERVTCAEATAIRESERRRALAAGVKSG